MGLKDKLSSQGSSYTAYDGTDPSINPLATKYSTLHYNFKENTEGWSTKGYQSPQATQTQLDFYLLGLAGYLPSPSELEPNDINGPLDPKYVDSYSVSNKYGNLPLI